MTEFFNKGDYGYWKGTDHILDFNKKPTPIDRDLYVNASGAGMANVIFPANPVTGYEGDVVPIGDNAGKNFAYAWCPEGKDTGTRMAYGRLKAKGYDFATPDGFKVNNEAWFVENGRICFGDTVLMACTAERYDKEIEKEQKLRNRTIGEELTRIDEDFEGTVSRATGSTGIQLEPITEAKGAKPKAKPKGR